MTLELYTKALFFSAPIEKFDKSLLNYFRQEKKLNELVYEGQTIYPPLSVLGQDKYPRWHTFQFKTHEQIKFDFSKGEIEVTIRKERRKKIYSPSLKFIFSNEKDVQKAYNTMIKDFNKISSKSNMDEIGAVEFTGKEYLVSLYCHKGNVVANHYDLLLSLFRYED